MQKIIILGATSEIAQQTQRILAGAGREMLLVGRSPERLEVVAADLQARGAKHVLTFVSDLADVAQHPELVALVTEHFADFDCVLLAYGTLIDQEECRHSVELSLQEWQSNFVSAAALLTRFADILEQRRCGCLAVITSVAGDRGRKSNYVYGAAKGALSLFLQGLRARLHAANVRVLTIKPGPVETPMTVGISRSRTFADPASVAQDICRALEQSSVNILYTPWYWRYVMATVKLIPETLFKRLSL
jgi:decaprenylphospho-beta-D-erythro-pentofuranosid-2-ulose 2-reductase